MDDLIPSWAQEIRERVVRIETKLDAYNGVREAAFTAKNLSETNNEAIKELKDDRKWLWRTTAGALILAMINLLLTGRVRW